MRRALALASVVAAVFVAASPLNAATPGKNASHGVPIAIVKANQSSNWFGYNQGLLEKGVQFHAITANWVVPSVSRHKRNEDEYSSTWAGIGGGCVDAACTVGDNTLIQAGTEQDVAADGTKSYSAWYELIPAPSITISNFTVAPGDHITLSIAEAVANSELWTITMNDVTRNESFSTTVPYSSTYATAEWIDETPLILGTNGGFAALPNMTKTVFDAGTVNGGAPGLTAAEEIQLINSNGKVYGAPSAPDSDTDGFAACAWATSCGRPSS